MVRPRWSITVAIPELVNNFHDIVAMRKLEVHKVPRHLTVNHNDTRRTKSCVSLTFWRELLQRY